jgi:antitoxin ParD1/3/4
MSGSETEKLSVVLTPELALLVRQAVEGGEYASTSEVIREALREWKRRRTERAQAVEQLGRLWDAGMESGPPVDADDVWERIAERIEAK